MPHAPRMIHSKKYSWLVGSAGQFFIERGGRNTFSSRIGLNFLNCVFWGKTVPVPKRRSLANPSKYCYRRRSSATWLDKNFGCIAEKPTSFHRLKRRVALSVCVLARSRQGGFNWLTYLKLVLAQHPWFAVTIPLSCQVGIYGKNRERVKKKKRTLVKKSTRKNQLIGKRCQTPNCSCKGCTTAGRRSMRESALAGSEYPLQLRQIPKYEEYSSSSVDWDRSKRLIIRKKTRIPKATYKWGSTTEPLRSFPNSEFDS